jgi:uncharacterized protein (DUF1499 family)
MIGVINQIENSSSYLEQAGDFFATPGRWFFGNTYRLEGQQLRQPEEFLSLFKVAERVTAIALLPLSLVSTLFGLALKWAALYFDPALKQNYALPVLIHARDASHFAGRLPQNPWTPNCVNSQQKSFWGKLYDAEPIAVPPDVADPVAAMKRVLENMKAILVEETENYLHYTFTVVIPSGPLKGTYIDDVDLYFKGDRFDIRSASRKGFRDAVHLDFSQMGANKKRIEAIREKFS